MNDPATFDRGLLDRLVVAIDGPSGSGKSTVARAVAVRLGLRYLDTGAMYRALTWLALRGGVPTGDAEALAALAARARLRIGTDPRDVVVHADGTDVTTDIRGADVTAAVSEVSAVPAVRARLVAQQRELADGGGIVVEGRDIGTVVFPDAPVKIFLTASGDARAARRALETTTVTDRRPDRAPGRDALASTRAELERRDRLDSSRVVSPLTRADDAVEVDTTTMSIEEAVDRVVAVCRSVSASTGVAARPR